MLSCQGVNLSYGEHLVLKDVSLSVFRGERIGLVGANGIGKSTLLKVLAGKISPNEGRVQRGHGAVVGYMPQEFTKAEQEQTVGQFLAISTGETEEFFSRLDLDPKILDQPSPLLVAEKKAR